MKQQIARLSPHQNGKVFAVLMALGSLVFIVPFSLMLLLAPASQSSPHVWVSLFFPVIYLIFGYISVAIGCWLYNIMFRFIGGIEYEAKGEA